MVLALILEKISWSWSRNETFVLAPSLEEPHQFPGSWQSFNPTYNVNGQTSAYFKSVRMRKLVSIRSSVDIIYNSLTNLVGRTKSSVKCLNTNAVQ
jgi:hypothetical protein